MQEGRIRPKVAQRAPEKPAIFSPTKVAELIAIGPGVIWEIVTKSVNSPKRKPVVQIHHLRLYQRHGRIAAAKAECTDLKEAQKAEDKS